MAMTVSSMATTAVLGGKYGGNSLSSASDPIAQAFDSANKRIGKQLESVSVQVSALGQIKSGFANLQSTGSGLSALNQNSTDTDVKNAAQSFVVAFNKTSNAISAYTKGTGNTSGALANSSLAGNDLKRALISGNNTAELKKIGISVSSSGTLSLDAKVLGNALAANPGAVRDALAKIGNQVEQVSSKELAGNIGSAVSKLSTRAKDLAAQQTAQQNAASSLLAIQQPGTGIGSGASVGVAAYMKVLFA